MFYIYAYLPYQIDDKKTIRKICLRIVLDWYKSKPPVPLVEKKNLRFEKK